MGGWAGRSGHVAGNTKNWKTLQTSWPLPPARVRNGFSAYFVPQPAENNTSQLLVIPVPSSLYHSHQAKSLSKAGNKQQYHITTLQVKPCFVSKMIRWFHCPTLMRSKYRRQWWTGIITSLGRQYWTASLNPAPLDCYTTTTTTTTRFRKFCKIPLQTLFTLLCIT